MRRPIVANARLAYHLQLMVYGSDQIGRSSADLVLTGVAGA